MLIVDQNGYQAMGTTDEILRLGDLEGKFRAFGFTAMTVDGHDESQIEAAVAKLWGDPSPVPKALIAKTVKGKGVSFMENNNIWHYTRLTKDAYVQAIAELEGSG